MGSAATIDLQRLLQPIPGNSPTGIDLRTQDSDSHESVYWQLRSARNESGEIERKHITDPANTEYDLTRCRWSEIISTAADALTQQSKDLEVAAWLCDSLVRVQGFAGLRDGLRLARELVEQVLGHALSQPRRVGRRSRRASEPVRRPVSRPPTSGPARSAYRGREVYRTRLRASAGPRPAGRPQGEAGPHRQGRSHDADVHGGRPRDLHAVLEGPRGGPRGKPDRGRKTDRRFSGRSAERTSAARTSRRRPASSARCSRRCWAWSLGGRRSPRRQGRPGGRRGGR